jgi:hypothetical protein
MRTRIWTPEDTGKVVELYRSMRLPYAMPDLDTPLFGLKRVVESENGEVIAAGAVKPIGEAFLWVDPNMSPVLRARALRKLNHEAEVTAAEAGYDELTAWIPPHIEEDFARSLVHSGWRASPWRSWSKRL